MFKILISFCALGLQQAQAIHSGPEQSSANFAESLSMRDLVGKPLESSLTSAIQQSAPSSITTSTTSKDSKGSGIAEFLCGLVLIPLALTVLWKNEKKIVTYNQFIDSMTKAMTEADSQAPNSENNGKLVHFSGLAYNAVQLTDAPFGVFADNCYRLKRCVEMYQWVETTTTRKNGDQTITEYHYNKAWKECKIDSSSFQQSSHANPTVSWPCESFTNETP
jgi:hypothetical protein